MTATENCTTEHRWGDWIYAGKRRDDGVPEYVRQCVEARCQAAETRGWSEPDYRKSWGLSGLRW